MKNNSIIIILLFVSAIVFSACAKKMPVDENVEPGNEVENLTEKQKNPVSFNEELIAKINQKESEYLERQREYEEAEMAKVLNKFSVDKNLEEGINYSILYIFGDFSRMYEEGEFGALEGLENTISAFKDLQFDFKVRLNDKYLTFDLTPYIFENEIRLGYERFCYYIKETSIEFLYLRSDFTCFKIICDFSAMKVDVKKLGFMSILFNEDPVNIRFYPELVNAFFNEHKIIESAFIRNFHYDDLCGFHTGSYICQVNIENGYANIELIMDSDYLKNIPRKIRDGSDGLSLTCPNENVVYKTKSYLSESSLDYTADKLQSYSNEPWCPSIPWEQEEIIISSDECIEGIYLGNGYYNEEKNYLYNDNCRVKKIEIEFMESHIKESVTLMDTAFVQFIPLVDTNSKNIKIKILSVYDGNKYNDLCINALIPVRRMTNEEYFNKMK